MARQQNTFEKLRREMEKKRKAKEKMEKKRLAKRDGDPEPVEVAVDHKARRTSVRQMTDAEILRMARNA